MDTTTDLGFVVLLKACTKQLDLSEGSLLHAEVLRRGLLAGNIFIGSTLVNMYAKCGALAKAQGMLGELSERNVVSWNALIAGFSQHGHGERALVCFKQMQDEGLAPNEVTFACILKACGSIRAAHKGKEIHAEIVRHGVLQRNIIVGNALIDLYGKCGSLVKAQQIFNELPLRNVVSWNTLISGYCENGHGKSALHYYELMKGEGVSPNGVTFLCLLKACGCLGVTEKGCEIHTEIIRQRLFEKEVELGNALVDMYAKCGALVKAQEVFDELPIRDRVAWTALISGYSHHGKGEEALHCFDRMKHEGLSPDVVSFLGALKACGSLGATEKGNTIHAEIVKDKLLGQNYVLGNALVDMYGKCGVFPQAHRVFDELPVQDAISWTSLIAGYCQHGCKEEAANWFARMKHEGCSPDPVTFTCILNAFNRIGIG